MEIKVKLITLIGGFLSGVIITATAALVYYELIPFAMMLGAY
jgi:hypothetical protein|tara:strand:- start:104 stop:229 length:126 start_codon:yes stop_codon:yes gene_type:complete